MHAWRRICCPVDLSDCSRAALHEAAALAKQLGADLLVLYVRHPGPGGLGIPIAPPPHPGGGDAEEQARLAAWVRDAQAVVPTTLLELTGAPAEEIARTAAEFACDLVVMGTHGRTGLARAALGSVAEAVVRSAPCPVLVVRAAAPP